ncbi:hypothetical protein [Clostridium sp. DJ247]|uniref:hypothetical protein n=1 Tax=Clostridium sp. DJ247 TaxID=2726188 RepID=UPI0016259988|nr:hypothetical protein [Clostridium sp. DJ247]MBC2581020.1 hypothetical protein [Clostridium sp. DJ247]
MTRKKFVNIEDSKLQSANDHNENSLDSRTGYMDTGNTAAPHAKARAIRNEDNGSHI